MPIRKKSGNLSYSPRTLFTLFTSATVLLMTQQLLPFPDRSKEIYACDVVWGYFPWTEILQVVRLTT